MKATTTSPGVRALDIIEVEQVSGGEIRVYPHGTRSTGYGVRADAVMDLKQVLQAAYNSTHPWTPGNIK